MKNIATALVKAQKAFGPALKSSTNPHFKSRYADLAACVEAVIQGLNDNGIALIQKTTTATMGSWLKLCFARIGRNARMWHSPCSSRQARPTRIWFCFDLCEAVQPDGGLRYCTRG
jgi:hypothetical protein